MYGARLRTALRSTYTDEAAAYKGLPNHETVKHSVSEYVNGQAHTNGMESFWGMLKWVGVDIWEGSHKLVVDRLRDRVGLFGEVHFTADISIRTDDGETASPFLRVKEKVKEPPGQRWTRAQMYEYLLQQFSPKCRGCDRDFDDPRYLQLDHNTPRSDGGLNHTSNRVLLCGPCNQAKSNIYTLSGLRRLNAKNGWMTP